MNRSRFLRLCLCYIVWLPGSAAAVNHIEIHVGEIRIGETRPPAAQIESLSATLDAEGRWHGTTTLKQGDITQLVRDYALPVAISKGMAEGKAVFSGMGKVLQQIKVDIAVRDVAFSDVAGLHAGEKISGRIRLDAQHLGERWQWQGALNWADGDVFWQPFYIPAGGHGLKAKGWLSTEFLAVEDGNVELGGIGQVSFRGQLKRADNSVTNLELASRGLQAGKGYELLAKPLLQQGLLGNLEVAGTTDIQAQMDEHGIKSFEIGLHDVDVEDKNSRFAFYKINASVPWAANQPTQAAIGFAGGKLLKLPLGAADLRAKLDGYSLTSPKLQIPLLDGALTVQDVSAARIADRWHWHLRADLSPIALPEFSHAMGWPRMDGKISAAIPLVTYSNGQLSTDGSMLFRAFDGTVNISNLTMQEPLGAAPRLAANMEMRNLDMEMLTRTFSFGAMTGRLDGTITGLELSSWQPVTFDARFQSSPGDYPRKISQRAVQNISSLGGAGAAAAIQRSFLRFFDEFNYRRIGLSCKLRNGICQMDGVEPAQQGYVIVQGSGVPSITVLGYNRTVSWNELLERLQRITQGNVKPVVN